MDQFHSFTDLFAQLGLPNTPHDIEAFIRQHKPLADDVLLIEAPFWTPQQAAFLREQTVADAQWAIPIDQLNAALRAQPSA